LGRVLKLYKKIVKLFLIVSFVFSKDQNLWDLGVKIKKNDKEKLQESVEIKEKKDNDLYFEIKGLSNKLNISKSIVDKESNLINQKLDTNDKTPTLIFNQTDNKENQAKIGLNSYQIGKYKDAIKYLNTINKSDINKINKDKIDYLKANAYFNLGEYEKSEQILSSILINKTNSLSDDALLLKGMILKQLGKKREALRVFTELASDYPNSEFYESAQIQKRILSIKK
jgi:tetratricopeptide (TPR) repeat protein